MKTLSPNTLIQRYPLTEEIKQNISSWRETTKEIIFKRNSRLLVIVWPCSIHNTKEALVYAEELNILKQKFPKLFIVMRTYFEKPRTTIWWKGLINDPNLDWTFDIEAWLEGARKLLLEINNMWIPVSTEFLDPIAHNYIWDLITWWAIWARTTESQTHREIASWLEAVIGFKNWTTWDVGVAIDAIKSSSSPHTFLWVWISWWVEIIKTYWNKAWHIILRGGKNWTNYDEGSIQKTKEILENSWIKSWIMIDASHANSQKKPENQSLVIQEVSKQLKEGNKDIIWIMIESNINFWNQSFTPWKDKIQDLEYGISITDWCINLDETEELLENLSKSL